jgi:hypothetical protein
VERARPGTAPRTAGALLAAALLLGEGWLYADSQRDALLGSLAIRRAADAQSASRDGALPLAIAEDLRALAAAVPEGARVLVVTDTTLPVSYDFDLLPRRMSLLMRVDALVAAAGRSSAPAARQVRAWLEHVEQLGQRLDARSLEARLPSADCLLTVLIEPAELPWPAGAARPQLIARHGVAAAWRLDGAR